MTRPAVTYTDPERAVVDFLTDAMDVPVGVNLPDDWTPSSGTFLQIQWDATPVVQHPVSIGATIRVIAWAATKTVAKAKAMEAMGRLCAYSGHGDFVNIVPLNGPLPATDPDHHDAELCSITVRATVPSTPLP